MNFTAKLTERQVLDLLRARHCRPGNGGSGEYAYLEKVRNSAGFGSTRTLDAVTLSLWPSRGLELHGYEVKCNRADWLRELKNPAKVEEVAGLLDRFSVVAAEDGIVKIGELPSTWGLLVVRGKGLVTARAAPLLPGADSSQPIPRDFLVALLRAGGAVPQAAAPEILAAEQRAREAADKTWESVMRQARETAGELRERIRRFEQEAGVSLSSWSDGQHPEKVGRAVRMIINGGEEAAQVADTIRHARDQLLHAANRLGKYLP